MASDVKWIKMIVGMFDGMSFKKIKKAKIGGESFRDKLTAVWFELMDFAGKCNHDGAFISPSEIPFSDLDDIAVMIDRDEEELKLCMAFYIKEGMVEIIDDVYSLANWAAYQNKDGLDKIREQTRKRVAKHRENQKLLASSVTSNVTVTKSNATDIEKESDKEKDRDNNISSDLQSVVDLYHSICVSFPSVRSLSDARKKAVKARLKTYSLDDFKTVFEKAEASSFLKGVDGGWQASFDWLIKEANMLKVLEGNYADKPKRYGRKEPVPGWCEPTLGDAEIEAIQRVLKEDAPTIGNDPELAERAEKLRKQLHGGI